MALFGLLWVLRVRSQFQKEKRQRQKEFFKIEPRMTDSLVLVPPPLNFADEDEEIPPPPPPPFQRHHGATNSLSRNQFGPPRPIRHSRLVHSLPIECTCPSTYLTASMPSVRRGPAVVRFCDDPLGIRSARGHSWSLASAVSTLPRRLTTSSSTAQGITSIET